MNTKKLFAVFGGFLFLITAAIGVSLIVVSTTLPTLVTIEDYKPLLVPYVYANNGEKIGEFYR